MSALDTVKPGDLVILSSYYSGDSVARVEKVTKLHFTLAGGRDRKFRKRSGSPTGEYSYHQDHVRAPQAGELEIVRAAALKRQMVDKISIFKEWKLLTIEQLRAVAAEIQKAQDAGSTKEGK